MTPNPSRRGWVGAALVTVAAGSASAAPSPPPPPPQSALQPRRARFRRRPDRPRRQHRRLHRSGEGRPLLGQRRRLRLERFADHRRLLRHERGGADQRRGERHLQRRLQRADRPRVRGGPHRCVQPRLRPRGPSQNGGARSATGRRSIASRPCRPCVAACPVTRLQPANYWIARTLEADDQLAHGPRGPVFMHGMGANPATLGSPPPTPPSTSVQMGPDNQPAHIGEFLQRRGSCTGPVGCAIGPAQPAS